MCFLDREFESLLRNSVTDGIATTNQTVSLTFIDHFNAQTNTPDAPIDDYSSYGPFSASQLTGGVQVSSPLSPSGRGAGGEGDASAGHAPLLARSNQAEHRGRELIRCALL